MRHLARIYIINISCVLLILLSSFLLPRIFLLSQNTLYNNGRWIVTKTLLKKAVCGAFGFLGARNSLSGERLDLSKWHGFQEIIYKDAINIREITFDFLLNKDSYCIFIFNKNSDGFSGIRVSNSKLFKSLYFVAKDSGEFTQTEALEIHNLRPQLWNHFKMVFEEGGFALYINNVLASDFKSTLQKKQYIGFRGGNNTALIDNINIKLNESDLVIHESFDNKNVKVFFVFSVIVVLINIIVALFFRIGPKFTRLGFLWGVATFNILIIILSSMFLLVDCLYLLPRYPSADSFELSIRSKFRIAEKLYWQNAAEVSVSSDIKEKFVNQNGQDTFKILFIGTSQTWGAGATKESSTFTNLLKRKLNELGGNTTKYECINAGISASNSSKLLDLYVKGWIGLNPKIVVINLSNNDQDIDAFSSNLDKFIQFNKSRGIKTIFVLEASSIECAPRLTPNHEVMRKVGEKNGIRTVDMHEYLKENYDRGILWWDVVHLTNFGQELVADYLFKYYAKR